MKPFTTTTLGYPRVGRGRPYKRMLENFWSKKIDTLELMQQAGEREQAIWRVQLEAGIDLISAGDFSLYDHVLDTALMLGCLPARYGWQGFDVPPELYFALARGADGVPPCEMTKWFDTNYHYLIPELPERLQLTQARPVIAVQRAKPLLAARTKPWMLGPLTFLKLANLAPAAIAERLAELTPLYAEVLRQLSEEGIVQIDEPSLTGDISAAEWQAVADCYQTLAQVHPGICLQTYYGSVGDAWPQLLELPVAALGVDLLAPGNREVVRGRALPKDKRLVLGVIDGRNVWRSDLPALYALVQDIAQAIAPERLLLSPSCPLWHLPETVADETHLPEDLRAGLCFAQERLHELTLLARALRHGLPEVQQEWNQAQTLRQRWLNMPGRRIPAVDYRMEHLGEDDFRRSPLAKRRPIQQAALPLPLLPTTTIGSFPQTDSLRQARAHASEHRAAYQGVIRAEIEKVVRLQEEIGLDVLVHGEAERNDMVQFFAEQLTGFAATRQGWVQSYGSRCVRPPLLYGDIERPANMSVELSRFAQSLTPKPVKGMLTGPVTMLQWSFVRDDLPRSKVAFQLALAIRDEVWALEAAGLKIIQIDEAAFREGLPLRRRDWPMYLSWAVQAFRLASSGVREATQIHTHMCYSEFGDIFAAIVDLDADVLLIEDARSYGEMLELLQAYGYPAGIGPGVYDIHSPNVPDVAAIEAKLRRTLERLPIEQVWVNPDCGLKTRGYAEILPALRNMVAAAQQVRETLERE